MQANQTIRQREILSRAAENSPYKRAVTLCTDPRVEMVGDECEAKTGCFGLNQMLDQTVWAMLFARRCVS